MSQFIYIDKDFKNMTEAERSKAFVCSGKIDFSRMYKAMFGSNAIPTKKQRDVVSMAYGKVLGQLSRCQVDLITAEFGINKILFDNADFISDTFIENPISANVEKLRDALDMIKEAV